jgi:radical SAM superfamily enzyme YgiQ (UPF0313 family)
MRSWQMEPLPCALIAGLTPKDVDIRFYDDRMEAIPYDEPADLVAISIETYTARRSYQIATEWRRRGVPVVMGGFHASLCTDEVQQYAESVVVGEAEELWEQVIDDYRHGTPKKIYRATERPSLSRSNPDRSIYGDKRYLPVALVEVGRGCKFRCEFCAIQTMFNRTYRRRPVESIVEDIRQVAQRGRSKLVFFVDDNFIASPREAKEILRAITPFRIRWVSQASINVAQDEELMELLEQSGCAGLLIGFESLNKKNLEQMGKGFNTAGGGYEAALAALRRHNIRLYVTFLFGYDGDSQDAFNESLAFARRHAFYITAFNHVTPFPGTPLYQRLEDEGRLLYDSWWMDQSYSYNKIPFNPTSMSPEELHRGCVETRRAFYSLPSILQRGLDKVNRSDLRMLQAFFPINLMHRLEVGKRDFHPLGDVSWQGELLKAA